MRFIGLQTTSIKSIGINDDFFFDLRVNTIINGAFRGEVFIIFFRFCLLNYEMFWREVP